MPLHRKILRLLLASLAIAAVTGATAVLLGGDETVMRVLGTAMLTSGAALLLYPLSRMIDHAQLRLAGAFGMGLVIVEYLLFIIMTWELPRLVTGSDLFEELLLTVIATGIPGMLMCLMLALHQVNAHRLAARVGLGVSGLAAILWLMAAWTDSFNREERLWGTGGVLLSFGLISVMALLSLQPVTSRYWRWLGVAASVIAAAMAIYEIWMEVGGGPEVFVVVASIAGGAAFANMILQIPLQASHRGFLLGTIGAGLLTLLMIDMTVIMESHEEFFGRLAAAAGVLTACSTLALLVLARLTRGVTAGAGDESGHIQINLTCPRCRTRQDLPLGQANCCKCDLRINIEVEEPTCPGCGYLLMHLTGPACPECGRAIGS